jgi:hypothetical protein
MSVTGVDANWLMDERKAKREAPPKSYTIHLKGNEAIFSQRLELCAGDELLMTRHIKSTEDLAGKICHLADSTSSEPLLGRIVSWSRRKHEVTVQLFTRALRTRGREPRYIDVDGKPAGAECKTVEDPTIRTVSARDIVGVCTDGLHRRSP